MLGSATGGTGLLECFPDSGNPGIVSPFGVFGSGPSAWHWILILGQPDASVLSAARLGHGHPSAMGTARTAICAGNIARGPMSRLTCLYAGHEVDRAWKRPSRPLSPHIDKLCSLIGPVVFNHVWQPKTIIRYVFQQCFRLRGDQRQHPDRSTSLCRLRRTTRSNGRELNDPAVSGKS
jgi:hypothetical protein